LPRGSAGHPSEIARDIRPEYLPGISVMQKLHMTVVNVVDRADNGRVIPVAQVIDIQRVTDLSDAVFHIQAAGANPAKNT
jgi:hypothetical protein